MNIIIDTHIFLWALSSPARINKRKRAELETAANTVYVSSVSIVEIMIKSSLGKLPIDFDPVDMAEQSGFDLLDFSGKDALPLKDMPFHHKDPFDRMLIAQSVSRNYAIMTDDIKFSMYKCKLL
jgi:PIN domain nuclease of toxin-antitoxin system